MNRFDLKWIRGDTYVYNIIADQDITGWKVFFTVKDLDDNTSNDNYALIKKQVVASGNSATINVMKEDTNGLVEDSYKYDIQLVSPDGNTVKTVIFGNISIIDDVTKEV